MKDNDAVRAFYDAGVQAEWRRLENHPVEFAITKHYLQRYIRPGERVLDLGGGPGRYALWLAQMGCDVVLVDLSPANVAFAREKAARRGLRLQAMAADAREVDALVQGPFDHVLLMGPLYHLLRREDRVRAVQACRNLLRPGGTLYASAITAQAGYLYYLQNNPADILDAGEAKYLRAMEAGESYAGEAFTQAYFMRVEEMRPFMEEQGFATRHLIGCEGVCSPRERDIAANPQLLARWMQLSLALCERAEALCMAEHMLYIGTGQ